MSIIEPNLFPASLNSYDQIASMGYVGNLNVSGTIASTLISTPNMYGISMPTGTAPTYTFTGTTIPNFTYSVPTVMPLVTTRAYFGTSQNVERTGIVELYRVEPRFTTSIDQFHLSVWRSCNEQWSDDEYLREHLCVQNGLQGSLKFYEREYAEEFIEWWTHYTSLFGETDYRNAYFPVMTSGKIDGYYMNNNFGTMTFQQQWLKIVKHIQDGAMQINNGWLFKTEADAALYRLISEG